MTLGLLILNQNPLILMWMKLENMTLFSMKSQMTAMEVIKAIARDTSMSVSTVK